MAKVVIIPPEEEPFPKDRLGTWLFTLLVLHTLGNLDLLHLPLTGLFCSRKCPGETILKACDQACGLREKEAPVIGGFHTPVGKDMLEILLKGKGPVVICPARGLEGMRIPKAWIRTIEQGRLLLASILDQQVNRVTKETAYQRNVLVAALASKRVFIHVELSGETEKMAMRFGLNE